MLIQNVSRAPLAQVLVAAVVLVQSVVFAESLSQPVERVRVDKGLEQGNVAPRLSAGLLLSWRPSTQPADDRPNLRAYSRDGKLAGQYRLWFPDASLMYIRDAAASEDGAVAAVGKAVSQSGVMVGYLATIPKGSSVVTVTALGPFDGERIVIAPDKSFWVLGYQTDEERKFVKSTPHALLHHYSAGGELLGKHLEWPELSCGTHPFIGSSQLLTMGAGRIGLYLSACQSWIDLTATGEIASRVVVRLPVGYSAKPATILKTVILEDGAVYAFVGHPNHILPNGSTAHSGLFVLRREQGLWEPVDQQDAQMSTGGLGWLAGIDGSKFAYLIKTGEVVWLSLLPR